MKKKIMTIALIFSALLSYSQQNTSLPIKVNFREGLIVFTIPPPYHTPNIRPMAVPGFVTSMRTMVQQEYSPKKDELLRVLEESIAGEPDAADNEIRLSFAKDVALYIYISNNNTSKLPEKARQAIETWITAPETYAIRTQIGLVKDYIMFGDQMTEDGNAK